MQDRHCPPLQDWQKRNSQSNDAHKPKISCVYWSFWDKSLQGLRETWRYLLPCAQRVGNLSKVCKDWDGSQLCFSPGAALAWSHLFFGPLLEDFQDRLILFFLVRDLLLICSHFPISYQTRKLLLLANGSVSGTIRQCTAFVLAVDCSPLPKAFHATWICSLSLPLRTLDVTKSHLCCSEKLVVTEYLLILRKNSTFFRQWYLWGSWRAQTLPITPHFSFLPCLSVCISLSFLIQSENPARQGPSLLTVFALQVVHWLFDLLLEMWSSTLTFW